MPPRPAPSSARAGNSQRQGSNEERALRVLERLAAAADLEAFAVVWPDWESMAAVVALQAFQISPLSSVSAAVPAVVAAALPALARGMQLAAEQLDLARLLREPGPAARLLSLLVPTVSDCFLAFKARTDEPASSERLRVALSVLAVRAGLPQAHEQLSLRLTSIISRPQAASSAGSSAAQQQQQQKMEPELARLVAHHLNVFANMSGAWPGGPAALFSPSLCQAVPAAAGLAVAALRHKEVLAPRPTGSGSGPIITTSWTAANNTAVVVRDAFNSASSGRSVPAQIAGSSSVGTLLLMSLGLAAERLHQLQRGLSPADVGAASSAAAAGASGAQQQQQQRRLAVPAHHTQLLQALGVAPSAVHPRSLLAALDEEYWTSTVSKLLVTPEQQQRMADAAVAASCQQPLLLVLLECALLHPKGHQVDGVSLMLQHTLCCEPSGCNLARPLLRAILEQDAGRRALEAAAPAPAAAVADDEAAVPAMSAWDVLATLAAAVNLGAVMCASRNADGDEEAALHRLLAGVTAVWLEHTAQFASLLEAGLRTRRQRLVEPVFLWSALSAAAGVAAQTGLSASSNAMAADSQQQVFALLLSCLKTATARAADGSSSCDSQGTVAVSDTAQMTQAEICSVLQAVVSRCGWLFAPPRSSSSGTSSQTSVAAPAAAADATAGLSAQLACVLLARCLVAAGRLLQQLVQATASSTAQPLLEPGLLLVAKHAATLLGQQLAQQAAAAAAEPWWQQLLDEHTQLDQQVESLQAQLAASGAANPQLPAAAVAGVAEQLQAFGAAACAALPVQQCCNHHDCRNLEQASELELVSGKSCVCGGCRLARYCSRECQVAHYKGWHKAVCKRLQAQRQQRQEAAAAAQQQQQGEQYS